MKQEEIDYEKKYQSHAVCRRRRRRSYGRRQTGSPGAPAKRGTELINQEPGYRPAPQAPEEEPAPQAPEAEDAQPAEEALQEEPDAAEEMQDELEEADELEDDDQDEPL